MFSNFDIHCSLTGDDKGNHIRLFQKLDLCVESLPILVFRLISMERKWEQSMKELIPAGVLGQLPSE